MPGKKQKLRVPVYCDCCQTHIANADPDKLRATPAKWFLEPMDNESTYGFFGTTWPEMFCTSCKKRPFLIGGVYHTAIGRIDKRKQIATSENTETVEVSSDV